MVLNWPAFTAASMRAMLNTTTQSRSACMVADRSMPFSLL